MAVFKTSLHSPSLTEIDIENPEELIFTAQINTSGEPIKAYKLSIFSGDGTEELYKGPIVELATPVKNKKELKIQLNKIYYLNEEPILYYDTPGATTSSGSITYDTIFTCPCFYNGVKQDRAWSSIIIKENNEDKIKYIKTPYGFDSVVNGNNYQWKVRVYNASINSTLQPNTQVCEGYLVGSTKNVTWVRLEDHGEDGANKYVADNIQVDRYIEYSVDSADSLIIGAHESEDKEKPSTYPYIQRKKISWVSTELGTNKDFLKIETEEDFDYDYVDGTPFQIYKCSSDHTVSSAFADPNTNINVANYILIYENPTLANQAFKAGDTPDDIKSGITPTFGKRKIVGYSSDTGEIRVHDTWLYAPTNGMAYRIFEQDVSTGRYTELFTSDLNYKVQASAPYYGLSTPVGTNCYATTVTNVDYYNMTTGAKVGTLGENETKACSLESGTHILSGYTDPQTCSSIYNTVITIPSGVKVYGVQVSQNTPYYDNYQLLGTPVGKTSSASTACTYVMDGVSEILVDDKTYYVSSPVADNSYSGSNPTIVQQNGVFVVIRYTKGGNTITGSIGMSHVTSTTTQYYVVAPYVKTLTDETTCTYVNNNYSLVQVGTKYYQVPSQLCGNITIGSDFTASDVTSNGGIITINNLEYRVGIDFLKSYIDNTLITNPYEAQVIGGKAVIDEHFVNVSNTWGLTAGGYLLPGTKVYTDPSLSAASYERTLTDIVRFVGLAENYCTWEESTSTGGYVQWHRKYASVNDYHETINRLFIQPNINNVTDDLYHNEIVFSNGSRVNIIKKTTINQTTGKEIDITFNKLDNSQWLLEGNAIQSEFLSPIPIIPQSDYVVYTDFMDCAPNNMFYARSTPNLTLQCRNYYQANVSTITSESFNFNNDYYLPSGTHFYYDANLTELGPGSENIYLPTGTKYYENYSAEEGFITLKGYTSDPIDNAVYGNSIYSTFVQEGTTYYVATPNNNLTQNVGCIWQESNYCASFILVDKDGNPMLTPGGQTITRYANSYNVRQNPVKYTNMPTVVYKQGSETMMVNAGTQYYASKQDAEQKTNPVGTLDAMTEYVFLNSKVSQLSVGGTTRYIVTPLEDFSQYYDYRDIQFNVNIAFNANETRQQVKYYKYLLYSLVKSETNNSWVQTLIAESEELYSIDVEWFFRGFERGTSAKAPKQYYIEAVITDSNDKTFTIGQQFGIYYPIDEAVVPLDLTYDCHEKGITINVRNPLYVQSTDLDIGEGNVYTSVSSENFIEDEQGYVSYIHITNGEVLNYTNIDNDEQTPIYIPVTNSMLTQFQITSELIDSIGFAGEAPVFKIANEFTQDEIDTLISNMKTKYNNPYNNNVKYDELYNMPVFTETVEGVEIITYAIPYYVRCLIAIPDQEIYIPANSGIPYYSDASCTTQIGTLSDSLKVYYVNETASTSIIGEQSVYVKNVGDTPEHNLYNSIVYINAVVNATTAKTKQECETYITTKLNALQTKTFANLALADNADSKLFIGITELNESNIFDSTKEDKLINNLHSLMQEMAYVYRNYYDPNVKGYVEDYLLTISDINSYYLTEDENGNPIYKENTNVGNLHIYKNGYPVPLKCFKVNNTIVQDFSMGENIGSDYVSAKQLKYMLQANVDYVFLGPDAALPASGDSTKTYILRKLYVKDGVWYVPGLYNYKLGTGWVLNTSFEYITVSNDSQLPSRYQGGSSEFTEATGVYDSGTYKWADNSEETSDALWIDNIYANNDMTKASYDDLWLTLFMQMNYFTDKEDEQVICTITASKGGKA